MRKTVKTRDKYHFHHFCVNLKLFTLKASSFMATWCNCAITFSLLHSSHSLKKIPKMKKMTQLRNSGVHTVNYMQVLFFLFLKTIFLILSCVTPSRSLFSFLNFCTCLLPIHPSILKFFVCSFEIQIYLSFVSFTVQEFFFSKDLKTSPL